MVGDYTGAVNTNLQGGANVADKTEKIQIRLTEDELTILKWLGKREADGMSDWICKAIKAKQKELQRRGGWTVELMRRNLK